MSSEVVSYRGDQPEKTCHFTKQAFQSKPFKSEECHLHELVYAYLSLKIVLGFLLVSRVY